MPAPILATKLYIPPPRPNVVDRPRLIERLNAGLLRKLTLISALGEIVFILWLLIRGVNADAWEKRA